MGWWSPALRTRANSWTFGSLEQDQVPDALPRAPVEPDRFYLSGFLRSMWITDVRAGVSRLYGTVHSHVSLPHVAGGTADFQIVVTPPDLRDVDPAAANRFVTRNIRLFGPVPYRGGDLSVELGLFSVKAGDFVGPFVDLLESISGAAGVALVEAAKAVAEPARRGFDLLLGTEGEAILEIGLATTFARPETGYFVVMRKGRDEVDLRTLRVAEDYRLVDRDGKAVVDVPYAVLAVEAAAARDDWFQIPQLAEAYGALKDDVRRAKLDTVKESLAAFKRTVLTSPDLLMSDAVRLVERVTTEIDMTMKLTQTAVAERALPDLAEIDLYG